MERRACHTAATDGRRLCSVRRRTRREIRRVEEPLVSEGNRERPNRGESPTERAGARRIQTCKWGRHCCRPHSHRSLSPAFPLRESPARPNRRLCRPALAPASGSVRRREGCKAPFLPAWRFRDRKSRGGPALHLAAVRPRPYRFHPRRAGSSGLPMAGLPLLFRWPRADPKIVANMLASGPRGIRHRVEAFRPYRPRPGLTPSEERSGLLASMTGRCARRPSRSSFASLSYPLSPDFAVDWGG